MAVLTNTDEIFRAASGGYIYDVNDRLKRVAQMGKADLKRVLTLPEGDHRVQQSVRRAAQTRLRRLEREEVRAGARAANQAILPVRASQGLSERQAWMLYRYAYNLSCAGEMAEYGRDKTTGRVLVKRGLFTEDERSFFEQYGREETPHEHRYPQGAKFAITNEGRRVAALLETSKGDIQNNGGK